MLQLAASLDQVSPHVLTSAVVRAAHEQDLDLTLPTDVEEIAGNGLRGRVGSRAAVGKAGWLLTGAPPGRARYVRRRADLDGAPTMMVEVLTQLLVGPTAAEEAAGFTSWFSDATADQLDRVAIDDGQAVVDFGDLRPIIPNASTSAGSRMLLGQLDATVFQFSTVTSVRYRIDGDCDAWSAWLQLDSCESAR